MWENGEQTKCWPQELFIIKPNYENDSEDEEYESTEVSPFAVQEAFYNQWMNSFPGSSE